VVVNLVVTNCSETQQDKDVHLAHLCIYRVYTTLKPGIVLGVSSQDPVIYFSAVFILLTQNCNFGYTLYISSTQQNLLQNGQSCLGKHMRYKWFPFASA